MHATIELAYLLVSIAFLAVTLGVVGFYVNKIIANIMLSRHAERVSSATEVARARAYARAHQA